MFKTGNKKISIVMENQNMNTSKSIHNKILDLSTEEIVNTAKGLVLR